MREKGAGAVLTDDSCTVVPDRGSKRRLCGAVAWAGFCDRVYRVRERREWKDGMGSI